MRLPHDSGLVLPDWWDTKPRETLLVPIVSVSPLIMHRFVPRRWLNTISCSACSMEAK